MKFTEFTKMYLSQNLNNLKTNLMTYVFLNGDVFFRMISIRMENMKKIFGTDFLVQNVKHSIKLQRTKIK